MLALRGAASHGYGILQHVEALQGLPSFLGPGSLYRTLKEMRESGLIEYREPPEEGVDRRLHYHGLTKLGRRVLELEVARLQSTFARSGVLRAGES